MLLPSVPGPTQMKQVTNMHVVLHGVAEIFATGSPYRTLQ